MKRILPPALSFTTEKSEIFRKFGNYYELSDEKKLFFSVFPFFSVFSVVPFKSFKSLIDLAELKVHFSLTWSPSARNEV